MSAKTTYHHGDLRQTLLDEAALLLREEGEQGLSMRRLAARAGVSRTAPYHHFRDKQDLLCAIAAEGFSRFVGILTIDGAELSRDRLARFIRDYLQFAVENAEYYDLMFGSQLWKSPHITAALQAEAHGAFRFYLKQARCWQDQGLVNPELDALRYAQVTWSTLHGLSRLLIDGIYLEPEAMDPVCEQAASMFWRELCAPPQ
ncbi:TetR family transcriptional regulator [Seongchinamella sediminis]|uniref:TetR family transcriptional regulator n=1 Tax=Seongchinamella sediminis TaxID=2283635 RepID=A0A3L7DVR3_9GAMM|nr:TetR/AcrR family transcriptional regulator [Seongchinamella sediminis]RLQ21647.1 TetR family transcriptional regulator [Seongchinamella sediminis]